MQTFLGDIRYALRQFRLSPVFTITAAATLALGIGGTTAIFSLMNAIMLRSLPVADPSALYRIGDENNCCFEGGPQGNWGMVTFPLFERLKTQTPEFEKLTAFQSHPNRLGVRRAGTERMAKPLRGEYVDGNYFPILGIQSYVGRLLGPADDRAAAPPTLVVSYPAWQARFGGDASLIGSSLIVEGQSFTVVGIAPPGFYGETLRSSPPDFWMPLQQEPAVNAANTMLRQPITAWLRVIGRLKPGASVEGMSGRLTEFLHQWLMHESTWPPEFLASIKDKIQKETMHVVPAGSGVMAMKQEYSRTLYILLTVCGLVLLIACANIANLMLARGMARRSNIALRMALGASRGRLVRQALTESVVLSLFGGLLGLIVADFAGRLILRLAFPTETAIPITTDTSWPVLLFAFGISLFTGVLFGTAPAWFATHTRPVEALRGANRTTRDSATLPQRALLVVQATLSVVLVAGAGMLTRSLANQQNQPFGIATDSRIQVYMNPAPATYSWEQLDTMYRNLIERLSHLPGVEQAALALYNPFTDNWSEGIYVQGHIDQKRDQNTDASWDRISPGYLTAVGQKLLRGRAFTDSDRIGSAPVAVVNEAFVHRFFKGEEPIGAHFGLDLPAEAGRFQVIGIVTDAKYYEPNKPTHPMFFVPYAQRIDYPMELMKKLETRSHFLNSALLVSKRDIGSLEPLIRRACSEVDPNITVIEVRSTKEQIALEFSQGRALVGLASLFGLVALVLAAVGLYGVTAYTVERRSSEIGVRMALGAGRRSVMALVLRGAFQNVLVGLVLGIPLAIAARTLMGTQLYNIGSWDPAALAIAIGSLAVAAFIAALIPAGRAASIDPMRALRSE